MNATYTDGSTPLVLIFVAQVKNYLIKRKPKCNFYKLLSKNNFQFFY